MAQHYMTVISDSSSPTEVRPTAKRFTFFESRRAAKWHREVAISTKYWTVRPVTTGSVPIDGILFPYANTQQLTKSCLGRTKSQEDTDRRLLDLIKNHGCKEVAFAACASHLSTDAVTKFLETEFETSADKAVVIESYLQAFVAAAYCKSLDFALRDRTFATILVAVAGDANATQGKTLHMLISAWKAGSPADETLHSRAVSLTATVFHNAKLKLAHLRSTWSWHAAREHRAPLLLLDEAFGTAGPVFQGCVNAFFPDWRCWTKWTPDVTPSDAAKQRLTLQYKRFNCLQELVGPDVVQGDEAQATVWQGLMRRQRLIPWLESKGFNIGVGLIVGDTESLLTEFMLQFGRVVDMALGDGVSSVRLLTMYVEREGLDSSSLTAWEDARILLIKPMPRFVNYVVDPKSQVVNDSDLDLIAGNALQALGLPKYQAVRQPIMAEIAACVEMACNKLDTDLRVCMPLLALNYEWLGRALRLWTLRKRLAESTWLHSVVDSKILGASKSQSPGSDLSVLKALHVRVKTLSSPFLLNALDSYVHSFVLGGILESKSLARALHTLWTKVHDDATREAGLTLATLENVRIDIRSSCIAALVDATGTAAEQLQDRLLQVKANVVAAYMDLTEVIVSLAGLLLIEPCWAALLWALLRLDDVFIEHCTFVERGYKAYARWIGQLNALFDGNLSSSQGLHVWLRELQGVEPVLLGLEAMEGSKNVMHRLLTTTSPEKWKWYLKILTKINMESKQSRPTSLLTLLLSLNPFNAGTICTAVFACTSLSDADFPRCERFLTLARKNKELAAARLAIWLNMPEFSPTLKAALIDVGEVLALKESGDAWTAAKKYYDDKVQGLVARAKKLEDTRMALMRTKKSDVEKMMDDLKLETPVGVSAILADLPAELADVVEDVAENLLELHFSLGNLHHLTKLALGVQGTETVIVALRVCGGGVVDAYCVHVEETVGAAPSKWHLWTEIQEGKEAPTRFRCAGKETRLSLVVARAVWRELLTGELDIANLYASVKSTIQNGANQCIVCAKDIGTRLHRATGCGSMLCNLTASEVDFGIRTEMVRHDTRVMDLLLTAVHAVAKARNMELLPGIHANWSDSTKLLAMLNALPGTDILAKANDMHTSLRLVSKQADLFVSWLCNSSRTFIISATGHWRIPNMPGIHQFLVVDNPPDIEAAFAKHNHLQPRMVLFHGTSMDRLYAILAQGLRVLSNTPLMKHGAASGAGIYFSTETSLPASYAKATTKGTGAFFKTRKDFDGPQVLLGCEHAGPANKGGVFVVTDPTKVVVRYVFLVPKGVAFPVAKDVVAPMVSTFYSLRASAAVSV